METILLSQRWGARRSGNLVGAFADGAVLFPLLVALSSQSQLSGSTLLATAGLAYWASAIRFRIPMPVQPLKSLVITALALKATADEIRLSAACVGLGCLMLNAFCDVQSASNRVPRSLIHGLQLGMGVLLMSQATKQGLNLNHGAASPLFFIAFLFSLLMIMATRLMKFPAVGWIATLGLGIGVSAALVSPAHMESRIFESSAGTFPRLHVLAALILPQMALTLANSVLGTYYAANSYFGEQAKRVTLNGLLQSIGLGNLLSAAVGGLPFCHGSGGLTAHIKGGSNHWISNIWIGSTLLILAFCCTQQEIAHLVFPPFLSISLLFTIGLFHMALAAPTWKNKEGKIKLIVMGGIAALTQNLLWVLGCGILAELAFSNPSKNLYEKIKEYCWSYFGWRSVSKDGNQ